MDYKQKYKEALDFIKNVYRLSIDPNEKKCIEEIFPELKEESEDEKIRETIIRMLYVHDENSYHFDYISKEKCLAWLEKQKTSDKALQYLKENHSPSEVSDFQAAMNIAVAKAYDKGYNDGLKRQGEHANFCNKIQIGDKVTRNRDGYLVNLSQLNRVANKDEKQGEQKSADKVEPKFKEGDYIERKDGLGCHAKIIFVGGNVYGCEKLIYSEDESPFFEFMFKNQDEFQISSNFKQKPAWSEEDERMWSQVINEIEAIKSNSSTVFEKNIAQDKIDFLKSFKDRIQPQQQEWSEEDEIRMDNLCHFLEEYGNQYYGHLTLQGTISWLKSLKPQPKQEWSEEDEKMYQRVLSFAESEWGSDYDLVIWLKSLKPKSHWKPSDEQMIVIQEAIGIVGQLTPRGECLKELAEQLKKLKE